MQLLLAVAASADTFGPVIVESRAALSGPQEGTYHEYRFVVMNPSPEPHLVRIEVSGDVMGGGTVQPRASRTVVVAPQSNAVVSIPQYVVNEYIAREAIVDVDGSEEGTLGLGRSSPSYTSGGRDILVGRSVESKTWLLLIPSENIGLRVLAASAPAEWSPNWIHYSSFEGALLNARDWNELPRSAQTALLRWVSAGGSITFFGTPEGIPQLRPAHIGSDVPAGHHGFGWIFVLPEDAELTPPIVADVQASWRRADIENAYRWQTASTTPVPLLDDASLPVGSLFSLLVVFAIVGGPVNIFLLAKKQRRLWVFWTLPVLGLITAAILVGAIIAREGWVRIQKSSSFTLLDEPNGEATTLGWSGLYATLPPDGEVRWDNATEVRPLGIARDGHTDWTDGQRFVSGWIGSRIATGFVIRKVEPRRERLPLRRQAGHLLALNGLGADVKQLWVADEKGAIHSATNVAAGKEIVLVPTGETVDAATQDAAHLFGSPTVWSSFYDRLSNKPRTALRPMTYVAVFERSPFVEAALAKPTKTTSPAVLLGYIKEIADAS